jgi:hypothetical protein
MTGVDDGCGVGRQVELDVSERGKSSSVRRLAQRSVHIGHDIAGSPRREASRRFNPRLEARRDQASRQSLSRYIAERDDEPIRSDALPEE